MEPRRGVGTAKVTGAPSLTRRGPDAGQGVWVPLKAPAACPSPLQTVQGCVTQRPRQHPGHLAHLTGDNHSTIPGSPWLRGPPSR